MAETLRIEIPIETVDHTDPALSNVTRNFERMERAANQANTASQRAGRTVTQFDRQASRTERSLANWARQKYEVLLEAKERITPILSTIGGGLKSFAGKTWNITMRALDFVTAPIRGIINLLKNPILQVGAVLGISVGLKDTIETYKDFEAAMSQVQAVSGATDSELTKLTNKAKEMGATTKFTAKESAEAFNYMAMAGWKTEDMLGGIEGILNLAAASGEDLATTSDIVTDALTAFGMKASDAGRFSDVLAAAASNANTTVSGMGETFKYAGSMAGSLGYSIEDVALMTGLMANTGVKSTMAGTALNSIFTRLSTNTSGAADALSDLGIAFYTSEGNARDLSDVMEELRKATAGMNDEQKSSLANTVAGTVAQKGLLAILNASEEDYNKLADAINNAEGAAASMSDIMMDNLQGSITYLQSAADGVKITLGGRISPYIRGIAEWLTDQMPAVEEGLDTLMDWVDSKIDRMKRKFAEITSTIEWRDADFFGKAKIVWDDFIVEPFMEWWNSTGKVKMSVIAGDLGEGIGTGLKYGIMTLLGIDLSDSLDEGTSVGASFAKGFAEGFDADLIMDKLGEAIKHLFSNAGKLLPGGEEADLSSILSLGMLAKISSPFLQFGKGAFSLGRMLFSANPVTGTSIMGSILGSSATGAGLLGKSSMLAIKLGAGNLAGGASMSAGALSATGLGAGAGAVIGGATLVSSAMDAYHAFKSEDKDEKEAYGKSAGWKAGGVAAGAATGAIIGSVVPVLGTAVGALIGAGVGGISGWIKGNKIKEEYEESQEEMQLLADKAQYVYKATSITVDETTKYANETLTEAMKDTELSAEEFANMFQESCADVMKEAFGDVSLSLAEIKKLAEEITFGEMAEGLEEFHTAVSNTDSSLSTLRSSVSNLKRENWKVGLGLGLSETDQDEYKQSVDAFVQLAKEYVEDSHYEATVAISLLTGGRADTSGLDSMYESFNSQIDSITKELSEKTEIALSDGVITLDENSELISLQQQITDITNKLTEAQNEAELQAIGIKFQAGGADLTAESFAGLQEELAAYMDSATQSYDDALVVTLSNLSLQLSEGAISEEEYNSLLNEAIAGYNGQIEDMNLSVTSFNLQTIADAYGSQLDGILPDIEGTIYDKLQTAMSNAMAEKPDVGSWDSDFILDAFDLNGLSAELQANMVSMLQTTAEMVPQTLQIDYSGVDFIGPFTSEYYEQVASADLTAATEQLKQTIESGTLESIESLTFSTAGNAVSSGIGTAIQDADMSMIHSAIDNLKSSTDSAVDSAFSAGISTTMPVDLTLDYNILNPKKTLTVSGSGGSISKDITISANIKGYAAGDYVSGGPQLSWLAEEGYGEFIIPTNPSRRSRALELYEQAGKALGVSAYAEGGYAGTPIWSNTDVPYRLSNDSEKNVPIAYNGITGEENSSNIGNYSVQVNVSVAPEFVIQGGDGQSEESIMLVVRKHLKEIADEMGGEIAGKLEEVFSNMPLKEA